MCKIYLFSIFYSSFRKKCVTNLYVKNNLSDFSIIILDNLSNNYNYQLMFFLFIIYYIFRNPLDLFFSPHFCFTFQSKDVNLTQIKIN